MIAVVTIQFNSVVKAEKARNMLGFPAESSYAHFDVVVVVSRVSRGFLTLPVIFGLGHGGCCGGLLGSIGLGVIWGLPSRS